MIFYERRSAALRFAAAVILCASLVFLFVSAGCAEQGDSHGSGNRNDPPAQTACEILIEVGTSSEPAIFAYTEEKIPLKAECPCGKAVRVASLDSGVLRVEGNSVRCQSAGTVELCAYHADGTGFVTRTIEVTRGIPETPELPALELRFGESLTECIAEIGEGFSLAESEEPLLMLGENEVRLAYNPKPECFESLELTVTVTLIKGEAVSPERTEWNFSDRYFEGMTLGHFEFDAPGFFWDEETEVFAGSEQTFPAWYTPDDERIERYPLSVRIDVEKGIYEPFDYPEELGPVTYDEGLILGDILLAEHFRWTTPEEVPAVAKPSYAASYNADPDNFVDLSLEISLRVDFKASVPAVFPEVKGCVYFPGLMPAYLLNHVPDKRFYFESNMHLHGGVHELTLCFRENENYFLQTEVVTVLIERADRSNLPKRVSGSTAGDVVWIDVTSDEPFAEDLEFSWNGTEWTKSRIMPKGTVAIWYRYGETRDFNVGAKAFVRLFF